MGDMDFTQAKATLRKRLSEVMAELGEKGTKKVRITKASNDNYWYADKVGEVFEVENGLTEHTYVTVNPFRGKISVYDCEDFGWVSADNVPQDFVNSPSHYGQSAKFETIEMIEEITKGYDDGYVGMCVGNALKYLARAPYKHGEPTEDLSKAAKYLAFATEYLEKRKVDDE